MQKDNFLEGVLRISILIFIILVPVTYIIYSFRAIFYPYVIENVEGFVLSYSVLIKEQGNYFFNIYDYPFILGTYPPVYPLIITLFLFFFQPNFFTGRLINFFIAFIIAYILYNLFYRKSKNPYYSSILAILFLSPYFVIFNSSIARVDILALLFSIVGLLLYERHKEDRSLKRFLSVPFFILAFFTKQSAVIAPLTILVFNFFKNKKEFRRFSVLYTTSLILVFFLLNIYTGGEFYKHMITNIFFIDFQVSEVFFSIQIFIINFSVFIALFLFNIIYFRKYALFTLYFLLNLITIFISSKPGADINYFIEPYLSLLIISGLVLLKIFQDQANIKNVKILLSGVLLIQIIIIFPYGQLTSVIKDPLMLDDYAEKTAIQNYLKNAQGLVLSEDIGFLALNNLPIFYESSSFLWLADHGLWNPENLINYCKQKKFSMIIVGDNINKLIDLIDCIKENYLIIDNLPNYNVYISADISVYR